MNVLMHVGQTVLVLFQVLCEMESNFLMAVSGRGQVKMNRALGHLCAHIG